MLARMRAFASALFVCRLLGAAASKDGICVLYANDDTRTFFFSGVSPSGALSPQLLALPSWDAVLVGLDAGEDDDTFYIAPQGVGSSPNVTVATLRTRNDSSSAVVTYATLGQVPGFPAPFTSMNTLHLDPSRAQMIATLIGLDGPPPARARRSARRQQTPPLRDPGDLWYVVADVFPSNGSISRVWLDLSEQDMRWGQAAISGVSAFDGTSYWVNPISGDVPSGQALYGFPLNGSAPTVVPYGSAPNLAHLFYSAPLRGLLAVLESDVGAPRLARFSPPSANFSTIFEWSADGLEDWGVYDVSPNGTLLLAVLVDKNGENPAISLVDLELLKEVRRTPLKGFSSADTLCDINFCNYLAPAD